jgi:adsorption protein B
MRAVSAALLSAALGLAFTLAHAEGSFAPAPNGPYPYFDLPRGEFAGLDRQPPAEHWPEEPFVEEADADDPASRNATSAGPVAAAYTALILALTIVVAALIFISSVDDAFVDAYYWLHGLRRRKNTLGPGGPPVTLELLRRKPEAAFAIMVPAWKEHDVIAAMIANTVKTLDYQAFRIFCGVYRNDPATAIEVDLMALRYPGRVTRVDVPHDGPTCKGDCLNHIVRRVLAEEHASGTRFAGMVLHDSEDVIHPLELQLFNALLPRMDLVQLPVFSLSRKWAQLTAGTYIDDFAESHAKDIAVREALVGIVPGAGVATCYSRRALQALWSFSAGEPFNTASLTEDYDLSFRLKSLGMAQTFCHAAVDCAALRADSVPARTARVIATHEYFPDRFKAAYRQRTRWILGIAFQGWQHMRWRGSALERYFLFRDRKAVVMAPAAALAYMLLLNFALVMAFGSHQLRGGLLSLLTIPGLEQVLLLNLAFLCNRALQRMYFVGRYYGPLHALLSVARMPVNNLINFFAVMRAWRLFLGHLWTGKKLAWDKTAHVFPDTLKPAPAAAPAPVQPRPVTVGARLAHSGALAVVALCCAVCFLVPRTAFAAAPPLTGTAYKLADQAYQAVERGELERAMKLASQALRHAPGHASLLLLQADILSRQGKHAEALQRIRALQAGDLGGPGLAQRGYLHLQLGDRAAAAADFAEALNTTDLSPEQRANVSAELTELARATADAQSAERDRKGHELADQAYKAMEAGQLERALMLTSEALALAPKNPSLLAQRGYLWLQLENHIAAERDFTEALKVEGLDAAARANVASELAYLALRRNDDAAALQWFEAALASPRPGMSSAGLYADAGYAATRLGRNSVAASMFSKAVDEWHAAPPDKKPFDDAALFGMRRSVDTLSRSWRAVFSIGHSSTQAAAGSGLAASGSDLRVVQIGAELSYTPERFGYRNERIFQLYANAFQALSANEAGYATGTASRVAGLGARYKPLQDHNLVLALERRLALGARAGDDDWLLRAGWSASRDTDWHPTRSSWTTWQVYTETAYFIESARLIQPFEARLGRSWKLRRHGAVATPYVGIAGEYDRAQSPTTAAGIGPGVAVRYWFGETRHRAFPSHLDFSVQYRYRLTDAERGGGLFGQVMVSF